MQNYILTTCSTVDLSKEHLEKINVPCVYFHYNLNGKDYDDDLWTTTTPEEFYKNMRNGAMPTTSQVNVDQFTEFFEEYLSQGKDVLHIAFSSGLSGSYNSARIACEDLSEKYPERKIYVIDGLGASGGHGLLVDVAADMRDSGMSIDELRDWVENNKLKVHHWFFSTDLTSYIRGGRISAAAGTFAGILGICPLLNMNNEGKLIPRHKIRSKKKVIEEIVNKMEICADSGLDYNGKCFITHADCYEDAKAVADLVTKRFKNLHGPIVINSIGAVIGSHTGGGTVALFFFGEERSE